MAVRKATRSIPQAQPRPQQAKTRLAGGPDPQPQLERRPDHQLKAEIFETLRHLNRGYGVALAALDRLETKDRYTAHIFPAGVVHDLPQSNRSPARSGEPEPASSHRQTRRAGSRAPCPSL